MEGRLTPIFDNATHWSAAPVSEPRQVALGFPREYTVDCCQHTFVLFCFAWSVCVSDVMRGLRMSACLSVITCGAVSVLLYVKHSPVRFGMSGTTKQHHTMRCFCRTSLLCTQRRSWLGETVLAAASRQTTARLGPCLNGRLLHPLPGCLLSALQHSHF